MYPMLRGDRAFARVMFGKAVHVLPHELRHLLLGFLELFLLAQKPFLRKHRQVGHDSTGSRSPRRGGGACRRGVQDLPHRNTNWVVGC